MSGRELAKILSDMYRNPLGARQTTNGIARKPTMVHLFGIMYANEIEEWAAAPANGGRSLTQALKEIAQRADIPESYYAEVDKGRLLAEYVTVRDESVLKWSA